MENFKRYRTYQWHCSPITLNINGKEISGPIEVGDLFNEYFSSIADNFDVSLQNIPANAQEPNATNQAKFSIPLITIDDILNLVAILDQNKATGLDGIPAYFIKSSTHSIVSIILTSHLHNTWALNMVSFPTSGRKLGWLQFIKLKYVLREAITGLFQLYPSDLNCSNAMLLTHI